MNVDSGIEIILATILLILYFVYLLKTDSSLREMLGNYQFMKRM